MENDKFKELFDGMTVVPYSKEFTERVMKNVGYRSPVPVMKIFLLLLLWGGAIYVVLDNPELLVNNIRQILSANVAGGSSSVATLLYHCFQFMLFIAVIVGLSVFIVYDSISVSFDKLTTNMIRRYRAHNAYYGRQCR